MCRLAENACKNAKIKNSLHFAGGDENENISNLLNFKMNFKLLNYKCTESQNKIQWTFL